MLPREVALKDESHFLGPESVAGCCGVSAVSPAVNHTVWVANHVTLFFFSLLTAFLPVLKFAPWIAPINT